jgi:hypothetical protein
MQQMNPWVQEMNPPVQLLHGGVQEMNPPVQLLHPPYARLPRLGA